MQMLSYAHLEGRNSTPTNSSCLSRLQYSGICSLFPSRPSGHHKPLWSMSMTPRRHSGCSFRLSTQSPIPSSITPKHLRPSSALQTSTMRRLSSMPATNISLRYTTILPYNRTGSSALAAGRRRLELSPAAPLSRH